MGMLGFRLTGPEAGLASMMSTIEGIERVDRVEEVSDLMGGMRDDSSSARLSDDIGCSAAHDIEVHAASADAVGDVHAAIERVAGELGVAVEFVDDFQFPGSHRVHAGWPFDSALRPALRANGLSRPLRHPGRSR